MSSLPHIYLMAFACEPGRGSEPGVGFAFASGLARLARERGHLATLVTRPHRVQEIVAALGDDAPYLRVLPVRIPMIVVRATGRPRVRTAALLWQYLAVRRVRAELRHAEGPAVVHHVTFATEALPTFESALRGRAAIVFGPAGSAAVRGQAVRLRAARLLRSVMARRTLGGADLLIAQNEHVARSWAGLGIQTVVEPNVVVEPWVGERPPVSWAAAAAGLLIERKRFDLAIEAFAASGSEGRMIVIGDGPELRRLQSAAARVGVQERVDFVGALPRDAVFEHLARSAVLLHPSRQEGAGWVVGEAQAVGTVPIVFEGSGADGPVVAAGVGHVVHGELEALTAALQAAIGAPRAEPSDRWSADRLPDLLADWYDRALALAASRR